MASVAVVGVGAIGGTVAALLETTKLHEITLCTRRPLAKLTVTTPEGVVSLQTKNLIDPAMAVAVDWVLVATKTYDIGSVSAWLQRLCGRDTSVAVIQNGVEHRENFAAYVNAEKILPVIIDCPVERKEHGNILQRGVVKMRVEDTHLGSAFVKLFQGSNAKVELTEDFLTVAWQKLCMNAAGAVSALVMKPAGILRDEALGQVALDIVAECVAVGNAEGAKLDEDMGRRVLEAYRAQPPDSINSLLADRIARRPMETDARNGVIVRKGEKHGIKTPANKMVVALLKSLVAE
jgi:2-dehydropantoate 2-reductase